MHHRLAWAAATAAYVALWRAAYRNVVAAPAAPLRLPR
jgi:hypothetical protein